MKDIESRVGGTETPIIVKGRVEEEGAGGGMLLQGKLGRLSDAERKELKNELLGKTSKPRKAGRQNDVAEGTKARSARIARLTTRRTCAGFVRSAAKYRHSLRQW